MMRFWDYLRYRRRMLLAAAVCCVIFAASFALYRLPLRAVLYPVGLCLLVGLGFAVWDYRRTLKRHRALTGCGDLTAELLRELPPPESLAEEDYRAQLWGDRIFEKCGIRRDEGGDGGKTLEIRGKRRLSARDGGANYQQS